MPGAVAPFVPPPLHATVSPWWSWLHRQRNVGSIRLHVLSHTPVELLDILVRCAFLRNFSGCVRNITVFWQHLRRPINRPFWPKTVSPIYRWNPNVGPMYRPGRYIGLSLNKTSGRICDTGLTFAADTNWNLYLAWEDFFLILSLL